ncbi:MAG: hypothetical protein MUE95_03260 [Cyclobacteriaceae bacterium]|nr:hypothetical protein [Cyclobacteriaceae bacterium]
MAGAAFFGSAFFTGAFLATAFLAAVFGFAAGLTTFLAGAAFAAFLATGFLTAFFTTFFPADLVAAFAAFGFALATVFLAALAGFFAFAINLTLVKKMRKNRWRGVKQKIKTDLLPAAVEYLFVNIQTFVRRVCDSVPVSID